MSAITTVATGRCIQRSTSPYASGVLECRRDNSSKTVADAADAATKNIRLSRESRAWSHTIT